MTENTIGRAGLKVLTISFLLCLFAVQPGSISAQPAGWEDITPDGWWGDFLHIAKMSDGRMLTAASNGWIYESTDTAQNWHLLYEMPGIPQDNYAKFAMYEGTKGYLVTHKFVLYTEDSGRTWAEVEVPLPVNGLDGNQQDRHYLMHYKTADSLFFCTSTYRGTDVFLSGNGGKDWELVIKEFIAQWNPTIAGFHWQTKGHGYIYAFGQWTETQNGGKTWGPANSLGRWSNRVYPLCSYDNGSVLFGSYFWEDQTITTYISEDGNPNKQRDLSFQEYWFEQAAFTGKYVIAGDEGIGEGDCRISADSGKTWSTVPIKVADETYFNGAINFGEDTVILCGTGLSTVRTTDGGQTWDVSIFANGHNSKSIFCKNRNECFMLGLYGRLIKTDDGWETWKAIDLIPQINAEIKFPALVAMSFPTPDTGYVSGNHFLFRTIDGGDSWEYFDQISLGEYLFFPSKDTGYVAFTNMYPSIERTIDAGETWTDFIGHEGYEKDYRSPVYFPNAREGVTSNNDQLLFTKDAGETWQTKEIDLRGGTLQKLLYSKAGYWILFGGGNVYKCDNDLNCELKYQFDSAALYDLNLIERKQDEFHLNYTYYINYDGGTHLSNDSVLTSLDGGESWESRKDTLFKKVVFADASTAYLTTSHFDKSNVYRRLYPSTASILAFEKLDSVTYGIRFTSENDIQGIVYLYDKEGVKLSETPIEVQSGVQYTLAISSELPEGTGYYFKFVPADTLSCNSVKSPEFTIEKKQTALVEKPKDLEFRIEGSVLYSVCEQAQLYDLLGRKMAGDLNAGVYLQTGVYILKCGKQQQAIQIEENE